MNESYKIDELAFILEVAEEESNKTASLAEELKRLTSIGYLYSQSALDIAIEAKKHTYNAVALTARLKIPQAIESVQKGLKTMRAIDDLIEQIRSGMKES